MAQITVAAGTSQHKQEFAVLTIAEYFKKQNLAVDVHAVNVYTWDILQDQPDVIVLIGPQTFQTDVPVVSGVAFITKIGMESALHTIEAELKAAGKL